MESEDNSLSGYILQLLKEAINVGIKERDFWDMTISEILREAEGINFRRLSEQKDIASQNYILASLIVKGVSVCLSGKGKFPDKYDAYPDLFVKEAEEYRIKNSISNFINFTKHINSKIGE